MKKLKKVMVMAAFAAIPNLALANPTCTGKISHISVNTSGTVYATFTGSGVALTDSALCNINNDFYGISPQTCSIMFGMLSNGVNQGASAKLWFKSGKYESCSLSWKSLPVYGFYHLKVNK